MFQQPAQPVVTLGPVVGAGQGPNPGQGLLKPPPMMAGITPSALPQPPPPLMGQTHTQPPSGESLNTHLFPYEGAKILSCHLSSFVPPPTKEMVESVYCLYSP